MFETITHLMPFVNTVHIGFQKHQSWTPTIVCSMLHYCSKPYVISRTVPASPAYMFVHLLSCSCHQPAQQAGGAQPRLLRPPAHPPWPQTPWPPATALMPAASGSLGHRIGTQQRADSQQSSCLRGMWARTCLLAGGGATSSHHGERRHHQCCRCCGVAALPARTS